MSPVQNWQRKVTFTVFRVAVANDDHLRFARLPICLLVFNQLRWPTKYFTFVNVLEIIVLFLY